MPLRLPIYFIDDSLRRVPRAHEGRPVVDIAVYRPNGSSDVNITPIRALIDTGADLTYMKPGCIEHLGLSAIRSTQLIGATSAIASSLYRCGLFMGALHDGAGLEIDVCGLPDDHDPTQRYDLILGNLFFEQGVLHMDYVRAEFWFDYYTAAERQAGTEA